MLAGKARTCGKFWVFACVPNPGKQSIQRQSPPSARKQSTNKLLNRPVFAHVQVITSHDMGVCQKNLTNKIGKNGPNPDLWATSLFCSARKVAERKFPEFFEFSSRILPRICSEFSPNFSRTFRASFRGRRRPEKKSPKIPAIFQCKIPRQTRKKKFTKFF